MSYIAITSFLFIFSYFYKTGQQERLKIYYIFITFLFLFSAFRYQVGCDWVAYYTLFTQTKSINLSYIVESREPIFWSILWVLREMNLSHLFLNIVFSVIFFFGIHVLARRQPDPLGFLVLTFPILILNMPMSGIRQGAAIGVICIALVALIEKRSLKFLIWVIIASGLHISAIVFILLLPLTSGRYNNIRIYIITIMAVPTLIFFYLLESTQWALNTYVGTDTISYGSTFRVALLTLTGLYFFLCLREKWKKTFPQDFSLISIGSIAMVFISFILPLSSVMADRFGYYLIPIQLMIFARLSYLPFSKNKNLNTSLPLIGFFLFFLVWVFTSWHFKECYLPYRTWFLGVPH